MNDENNLPSLRRRNVSSRTLPYNSLDLYQIELFVILTRTHERGAFFFEVFQRLVFIACNKVKG